MFGAAKPKRGESEVDVKFDTMWVLSNNFYQYEINLYRHILTHVLPV
jgi:hypothetical protein